MLVKKDKVGRRDEEEECLEEVEHVRLCGGCTSCCPPATEVGQPPSRRPSPGTEHQNHLGVAEATG